MPAVSFRQCFLDRFGNDSGHYLVALGIRMKTVRREGIFQPTALIDRTTEIVRVDGAHSPGIILHPGIQLQDVARGMSVRHFGGNARGAAPASTRGCSRRVL